MASQNPAPIRSIETKSARRDAQRALLEGAVIAVPTDTVYGLAARIAPGSGIETIFSIKGRSHDAGLPVLASSAKDARNLSTNWTRVAKSLAARYWPGPLTLVVDADPAWAHLLGGDGVSVGLRVPKHRGLRKLLAATGPLAVTSANRSGEVAAKDAAEVSAIFSSDEVAVVLDGGPGEGVASSVVDCRVTPPVILREGALTRTWIEAALR